MTTNPPSEVKKRLDRVMNMIADNLAMTSRPIFNPKESPVSQSVEETIVEQVRIILLAKDIERATLKDYEEKLWAACDTDEDTDALARILYKASVPQKENE